MKLTEEQLNAVRCDENVMLNACPGSGKTRVIISKLLRTLDEVRDTPRAIACITYTNTAVHEIDSRLRYNIQPGDEPYFDICTIHSFCLNHVFRPFCYLIKGYKQGFKVLTPESTAFEKLVTEACAKHRRFNLTYKDFEEFTQLRLDADGNPSGAGIERGAITPELARDYWARIREEGFIDFANIIYLSFLLLKKRPEVLSYISAKFAWILVDEFQDTTDLQVEMLTLIAGAGRTRFLLVGDPHQSIFSFAGARPDLAELFASRVAARTDLQLSGNFRSSEPIVAHANLLFPRTPPMVAVGKSKNFTEQPVHQHGNAVLEVIVGHYLPALEGLGIPIGQSAILAPTWYTLFPLGRRLRAYGISIVGPGARPYRRNRLFAPLAEHVCGYLMEPNPEAIPSIERTLFHTVLDATGQAYFDIFSYQGRVVVFKLLDLARSLRESHEGAVDWLDAAASAFSEVLIAEEYLTSEGGGLFPMSVEEMKADMRNNGVVLENLTIDDLGIYANPESALKLSTLHNAKGREYEAVAMIDLNDGRIPHYRATSVGEIAEAKRLFYVGVTRARRFLLYVSDRSDRRNGPSRFLRSGTGVGIC